MSEKGRKNLIKAVCIVLIIGLLGSSLLAVFSMLGWL